MDHGPDGDYSLGRPLDLLDDQMPLAQGCLGCGGSCCQAQRLPPMRAATGGGRSEYEAIVDQLYAQGHDADAAALIDIVEECNARGQDAAWRREGPCLWNRDGRCTHDDIKPAACREFEIGAGTPGPAAPGEETCISIRHARHAGIAGG